MEKTNRRSFVKKSAIAIAGTGLYSSMTISCASNAPSDRVNIGVIGVNNFGWDNMNRMLQVEDQPVHCIALCDVDQTRLEERAKQLKDSFPLTAGNIKLYTDFRKLLEDKDIDGVIIATPDHWHTYIFAEAIKAGKAVYVEKPTGRTIAECNLMVDLQRKYKNVVTTGLWHASVDYFIEAFSILKSGVLGDVYKVQAWITSGTAPVTWSNAPQTVPATLDYKMWIGPAPFRPYAREIIPGRWRNFWDFGGGGQTDWVHYLDSALDGIAALGHERTYPKSIYSVGYKHPETMYETPRVQSSVFQFEKLHIVWEQQVAPLYNRGDGVAWIGSNGTLACNRTGYEIFPVTNREGSPLIEAVKKQGKYANQYNHVANWADCIRNNNLKTASPIDKGCYATVLANIANISYRSAGTSLEYLPSEQKFRNNTEADSYIFPEYQNDWKYPKV
ncbi:MAG TPA: Gfo/Idh/MocA family oxidoreductase [Bacteroidales bacterium]|nr:Gfo/Idh/MocA family oxidoreductase [Bacteroidales bacterium]